MADRHIPTPEWRWPDRKPSGPGKTPYTCLRHGYEDYEPCPQCESDVIAQLRKDRDELVAALAKRMESGDCYDCTVSAEGCANCLAAESLLTRIRGG